MEAINLDKVFNNAVELSSPSSVTILPTYRCTAACQDCCFESNPTIKKRLTKEELFFVIDKIMDSLPTVKLIVFSGGECFMLGDDLFDTLSYIRSKGRDINTRCVTNGYWGSSKKRAKKIAQKLVDARLSEINFSTGLDHQEFVPLDSVMEAAISTIRSDIRTLVTIESDSSESKCLEDFIQHDYFLELSSDCNFTYQVNSWMPFHESSTIRKKDIKVKDLDKGCDQLLENMVVTPHGRISACCGLTFEHLPEMIIGNISQENYFDVYSSQIDDLLKLWIKTHGPLHILKKVYGEDEEMSSKIEEIQHQCHACVLLHQQDRKKGKLEDYLYDKTIVSEILSKINIQSVIRSLGVVD